MEKFLVGNPPAVFHMAPPLSTGRLPVGGGPEKPVPRYTSGVRGSGRVSCQGYRARIFIFIPAEASAPVPVNGSRSFRYEGVGS